MLTMFQLMLVEFSDNVSYFLLCFVQGKLEMKRVKVFHQPTRNESMIISIDETRPEVDIQTLAAEYLDKEIYVGWPHLREAKVFAVSDAKTKIEKSGVETFDGSNGNGEFRLLAKHVKDQ